MIIHSPIFSGSITQAESAHANLSGSFSGSFTGVGNFVGLEADSVEFNNILNKPSLVSGSSQVSYPGLSNIPSGIISSSAQIDTLFNIDGLVSGSSQITYSGISSIPAGIVSSSAQVTPLLPSGVVSGSSQVDVMSTSNIPKLATTGSNIFIGTQVISGSLTVTGSATFTNVGPTILSGSISQVNLGDGNIIISDTPITTLNATAPLGIQNTIIGSDAGQSLTTGYSNSFFGRSAGRDNTTADNNTFIGLAAGQQNITGSSNTFLGSSAGQSNKASFNTFVGMNSGLNNNNGTQNTFLGYQSGNNNSVGNNNTFIGNRAGQFNESGSNNTLLGAETAASLVIGTANSLVGYQAGSSLTAGSMNTMLGFRAGKYQPGYISELVNTGYSIFIGADASGIDGTTNQIVIGYNAAGNGTNTTTIGNSETTATYLKGKLILSGSVAQEVTGSVNVNGAVTATSFNGTINANNGVVSGSSQLTLLLPSGVVSGSSQVSYPNLSNIPSGIVSGSSQLNTLGYATTGSNVFKGSQTISGSLQLADSASAFLIEGNIFSQTYLTANGAIVLNPGFGGVEMVGSYRTFKATDITAEGFVSGEIRANNGVVSGSSQLTPLLPSGVVSGSSQLSGTTITDLTIVNLTTINETASVIFSSGSNRFGDFGNDTHQFTGSVQISGSLTTIGASTATSYNGAINATNGVVSGSSQVVYTSLSSIPAGIVSGSSQIDVASTTGDIALGTRTSGNYVATITAGNGIVTSGATTGEGITHTISAGGGVVSGSSQITYSGISSIPAGIVSGSAQVTPLLPTGTVSGSSQVAIASTSGFGTYINQAVLTSSDVQFAKLGIGTGSDATYELKVSGDIGATGDIVAYISSDERLKNNVELISNPIEKVQALRGVTWEWNELASEAAKQSPNVGVIAQEVEKVLPQLVHDRENGFKGVDYAKLTGLLIEAIKEQQKQIDELKSRL